MHVDEEVRLLEEMVGLEKYFEHVFNKFENNGIGREFFIIQEAEDKQMIVCNQNEASSVEDQDRIIMENVRECMMMLTDTEVQEICDFEIDYFIEFVNHEEALEKQSFVFVIYEDETTSFCCNGISTEDERILHNDMLQEILSIELLNDSLVSEQGTLCNAEESAKIKFADSFMNFAEN